MKRNFFLIITILFLFVGFLFPTNVSLAQTTGNNDPARQQQEEEIRRFIENLIEEIVKELTRISTGQRPDTQSQAYPQNNTVTNNNSTQNNDNSSPQRSSSNSTAQSSGGAMKPFGGLSTTVVTCTCRYDPPRSWITLKPANDGNTNLPTDVIYERTSSILYEYRQVETPNTQLLGTVTDNVPCRMQVYYGCYTLKSAPKIYMVGTSGGSDGGGDGGSTNPPPSNEEDPPPPIATTTPPNPSPNCDRNSLGGWNFNPGIQNQIGDASESLKDLLYCMCNKLAPQNIKGLITSISDSRHIGDLNSCRTGTASNCAHSQTSCHYGGDNRDNKSYAVDLGMANSSAVQSAARACMSGTVLNEGNHLHVPTVNCRGAY